MLTQRPQFVKPGDESLYPTRNRGGGIDTLINPSIETALTADIDSHTTFVYNRYHHLPIASQRQKLPIFQYRNHILYLLEKYQTLVLIGETGCGKSTQVPQYLHDVGHKVCVTQPRVASAVSLACRVSDELDEPLGERVGYAAAMTSMRTPDTDITFMTEGVLLREMFASPLLMQYSCIILDEVHERSQMTDVLMGLLKKIIKKRKNLKLVVSSATMDAEFLKDFFNLSHRTEGKSSTSVILSVKGRTHPVDVFYTQEPVADYVKATVDTIIKIHENEPFGDILAFLTSQEEIHTALETLQTYAEGNNSENKHRKYFPSGVQACDILPVPMYGSLPQYRQLQALRVSESNVRKVILATNIAETSLTIHTLVYVIDCGFHKLPYFDPAVGVESLTITPIAKTNCVQRAGRAGRTARGKCYRLYTETEYENLSSNIPPEMCRSDLASMILQLKALGIGNVLRFTFPTPPPAKNLLSGLETLYALKAIDRNGDLTEDIGVLMAELPLKPMCAKMLCNSGEYGCIDEILSIAAILQMDNVFAKSVSGKDNMAARVSRRNHFEVAEGDIIMCLNIMETYIKLKIKNDEKKSKKICKDWCQKLYLNHKVMEKAYEIRVSLEKMIKRQFKMVNKTFDDLDLGPAKSMRIMKCVLSGYFPQAAYLSADSAYRGVRGAILHISPDSCLYRTQQPKWVIFSSVQSKGDKTYMRDLMTIDKDWLLEIAPHFYKES